MQFPETGSIRRSRASLLLHGIQAGSGRLVKVSMCYRRHTGSEALTAAYLVASPILVAGQPSHLGHFSTLAWVADQS
jgi:hypothetical protein